MASNSSKSQTPEKKRTSHELKMGVPSPREKLDFQQAMEDQLDKSSSGDEGCILDVGPNLVIEMS